MSLIIKHIKKLVGIQEDNKLFISGSEMAELFTIKEAFVIIDDEKILNFSKMSDYNLKIENASTKIIDARE